MRGRQIKGSAQGFQDIGTAATRRDTAIAMLDHDRPRRREDKHDGRRNVKQIVPVTAGPADVDHGARNVFGIDQRIESAIGQLLNKINDFLHALTFAMQRGQEIRLERVFCRFRKKQRQGDANIAGVQIDARIQSFNECFHNCGVKRGTRLQRT